MKVHTRPAPTISPAHYLLVLFAGALVAVGLPPLSWWPLMLVGIAAAFVVFEVAPHRARTQFALGIVFAWGWLAPAMGWMWHLVPGGFVIAPLLFASMHGLAAMAASRCADTGMQRIVVRAALHSLVEFVRFMFPFGGVPLAGISLGLADTRLAHLVRLVGPIGLTFWVFLAAGVLAQLWMQREQHGRKVRRGPYALVVILVVLQVATLFAPHGADTGTTIRIAVVQGGGPQGVLAIDSDSRQVIDRHLAASQLLDADDRLDLVVWPENTIDVRDFSTSPVRLEIAAQVRRIGAPFAVGVTEDAGSNFTNAQIIVNAEGEEISRYDKVRRVPYGEYVPLRGLLRALGAPVDRIPRDALAGTSPAVLSLGTEDGRPGCPSLQGETKLAVAVSWEVFFSSRVNDGVATGGCVVLNPTNGSSYTGEILQRQQVATSQLRALETGRFVVQAATTGYSMFVTPDGRVLERIPIGKQAVIVRDVPLRTGRTMYSVFGDVPAMLAIAGCVVVVVIRRRRHRQHRMDRSNDSSATSCATSCANVSVDGVRS